MPEQLIGCLTKTILKEYYRSVWDWFKDELIGHYVAIVFTYGQRRNDQTTGEPIVINTIDDIEHYVDLRGIEFDAELEFIDEPGKTRVAVIDVDSYTSWERTFTVVEQVNAVLVKGGVKPYFVRTGSKSGLHIRWNLPCAVKFDVLKESIVNDVLMEVYANWSDATKYMLDPSVLNYDREFKESSNAVYLDTAPLKSRAYVKSIGTVNAKTGSIARQIPFNRLRTFQPTPFDVCDEPIVRAPSLPIASTGVAVFAGGECKTTAKPAKITGKRAPSKSKAKKNA
jgi:hypothetical protein